MISKHIRNPDATAEKHRRIIKLVEYILNPETENATEKCVYHCARGFITGERSMQLNEMIALSEDATRSKNTVEHFMLSWREGEKPTPEQIEELITIWLAEMGLNGCQAIYGLHEDTDNCHLHIAVNRMHPERLECIKINGGFSKEAEHRAIALIENAQGWQAEKNARYTVLTDGTLAYRAANGESVPDAGWSADLALRRRQTDDRKELRRRHERERRELKAVEATKAQRQAALDELRTRQLAEQVAQKAQQKAERAALRSALPASRARENVAISQRAIDIETRTGVQSAERTAKEVAGPILRSASSWAQLHAELAAVGCRIEREGSGALIWVGDTPVKASQACRKSSLPKLEKRLGAYEPAPEGMVIADRELEPLKPDAPRMSDYMRERRLYEAERKQETAALEERHRLEQEAAWSRYEARRDGLLAGHTGRNRYALGAVARAEWLAERDELLLRQSRERHRLRKRLPAYPGVEDWYRRLDEPGLAELWRHRNSDQALLVGDADTPALPPRDIRAFVAEVRGRQVVFRRPDDAAPAFIDCGRRIDVAASNDREAARAALQLAKAKWGRVTVSGPPEYQQMMLELAAEMGVQIANPELQERLNVEIERRRPVPVPTAKPDWSRYRSVASGGGPSHARTTGERDPRWPQFERAMLQVGQFELGVSAVVLMGQLEIAKGTVTERLDAAERSGRSVDDVARELAIAAARAEAEAFQRQLDEAEREQARPDMTPDEPEGPGW